MEDVVQVPDDEQGEKQPEEGLEIPLMRIHSDLLKKMVSEFVVREWADEQSTLEERIDLVLGQLHQGKAKVMYDMTSETWNIIPIR